MRVRWKATGNTRFIVDGPFFPLVNGLLRGKAHYQKGPLPRAPGGIIEHVVDRRQNRPGFIVAVAPIRARLDKTVRRGKRGKRLQARLAFKGAQVFPRVEIVVSEADGVDEGGLACLFR